MSTRTARSVDRTVQKMLRQMEAYTATPTISGGSAATAAQALAQMAEIQKRIARGDTDAAQFLSARLAESKASEEGPGAARIGGTNNGTSASHFPMAACAAIAGVAALLLVGLCVGFSSLGSSHSVSGTVMLDKEPLSNVELAFQPKSGSGDPIRVTTTDQGTFSIDSIPAGDYAIFLSPGGTSPKVPKRYLAPESTPFRLKLTKDRSDLRMIASSGKRK